MVPLRGLLRDRRGVSAVEYGLILAAILLLVAAGYRLLGKDNSQATRHAEATLQGGDGYGAGGGNHDSKGGNGDAPGGGADNGGTNGADGQTASNDNAGNGGGDKAGNGGNGGDKGGGGGFLSGVGNFFKGAILGDFGGDSGWSGLAGQVVVGFIPIAGQIADVRDTVAGIKAVVNGEPGGWAQLGGAAVAWIPGVGDLAKAGIKGARHADEVASAVAKGSDAAKGGDEVAGGIAKNVDEAAHLDMFRDGGSFLVPEGAYDKFIKGKPTVGRDDGQFMTTKGTVDQILKDANGDINIINQRLGTDFPPGTKLVRIDVPKPLDHGARLPTGKESGANEHFIPGGYTSGGIPEIVTNPIPSGNVNVTTVPLK
ncbi:hypothetical protein LVJ94_25140 [Pendulispora rubella]|uniref:Uncharacterized protein n=1 Tax=Pendulispora rubella TaxID=2741070 RepID=A0ABZ2LMV7_9BACT